MTVFWYADGTRFPEWRYAVRLSALPRLRIRIPSWLGNRHFRKYER